MIDQIVMFLEKIWNFLKRIAAVAVLALVISFAFYLSGPNAFRLAAWVITVLAFIALQWALVKLLPTSGFWRVAANAMLLCVVLFSSGVSSWFASVLPLTSRTINTLPKRADVTLAKATFDPGVHHDSALVVARMDLDSLHAEQFKKRLDSVVKATKAGIISPDSLGALINDTFKPALESYKALQQGKTRVGQKHIHTDTTKGTVTYNVKNRELRVGPVPAHCKIVLTGSTTGYSSGTENIPTVDGGTYFATAVLHPEQFLAPGFRIFCIFSELSETEEQVPFTNGTCTLENRSDDAQECVIQINERDCNTCWMDNSGTVLITYTIEPIS